MGNPVVHFEIIGKDGKKLQQFYGNLFDWKIDANNPMNYGMVEAEGHGIGGGIGDASQGGFGHMTIYVEVPDLQASLDKAVSLGGTVVMPPTEIPGAVIMAMFNDPEGHLVGLTQAEAHT